MQTYKINTEQILMTQLADEGVVYDIVNNEYYSLNPTMFHILKGIESGQSEEEIIQELLDNYEINENECRQAVRNSLQELVDKKMII